MKNILLLLLLVLISSTTVLAQSSEKTLTQLKIEKEEAVKAENYTLASELKKQIEKRQSFLEVELKTAVENEDYEKAATIKKELNSNQSNDEDKHVNVQTEETPEEAQESDIKKTTVNKSKTKYNSGGHVYVGLLNRRNASLNDLKDYDGYYINLQGMAIVTDRVVCPALSMQIGLGSAETKNSSYKYSSNYGSFGIGFGVSTNFGWKNNNTRFKPFAVSTFGIGYEWYLGHYRYDTTTESDENNLFFFNYNFRVGFDFYITDRYALSMIAGFNRYNSIGIGLTF